MYDVAGRSIRTLNGAGEITTSVYDAAGQTVASIDPLGNRDTTVFDDAGRSLATINSLGNRTTSVYDKAGRTLASIDALGNRSSTTYDAVGRSIRSTNAESEITTTVYDAAGQSVSSIDGLGNRSTSIYDDAGRQIAALDALAHRSTTVFDDAGRSVVSIDALGNRNTTVYDDAGRTVATIDPRGNRSSTIYDAAGRSLAQIDANSERTTTGYDSAGRQVTSENALGHVSNLKSDNSSISQFDYEYDAAGRRRNVEELSGDVVTWTYDDSGQLKAEHRDGASGYATTFTYDASGNRIKKEHDGDVTLYGYDNANQMSYEKVVSARTTYSYDADGNQTRVETPSGDLTTSLWDHENQNISIEQPSGDRHSYTWNCDNIRCAKEDELGIVTSFVWDQRNTIAEVDEVGDPQARYAYAPREYGDLISQHRDASIFYHHFEAQGSTSDLTDEAEVVTDTWLYRAFGETEARTGSSVNPYQWVGRQGYYLDDESGRHHLRRRMYDSGQGRFLSRDPLGDKADDDNAYRYVQNNATNGVDPSGLHLFVERTEAKWVKSVIFAGRTDQTPRQVSIKAIPGYHLLWTRAEVERGENPGSNNLSQTFLTAARNSQVYYYVLKSAPGRFAKGYTNRSCAARIADFGRLSKQQELSLAIVKSAIRFAFRTVAERKGYEFSPRQFECKKSWESRAKWWGSPDYVFDGIRKSKMFAMFFGGPIALRNSLRSLSESEWCDLTKWVDNYLSDKFPYRQYSQEELDAMAVKAVTEAREMVGKCGHFECKLEVYRLAPRNYTWKEKLYLKFYDEIESLGAARDFVVEVIDDISDGVKNAIDALGNAAKWLYSLGKDVLEMLSELASRCGTAVVSVFKAVINLGLDGFLEALFYGSIDGIKAYISRDLLRDVVLHLLRALKLRRGLNATLTTLFEWWRGPEDSQKEREPFIDVIPRVIGNLLSEQVIDTDPLLASIYRYVGTNWKQIENLPAAAEIRDAVRKAAKSGAKAYEAFFKGVQELLNPESIMDLLIGTFKESLKFLKDLLASGASFLAELPVAIIKGITNVCSELSKHATGDSLRKAVGEAVRVALGTVTNLGLNFVLGRLKPVLGKIGEFLNKLWDCLVGTLVAILSFLPRVIKKYWDKLRSSLVKKGAKRVPCPCKCANKPDKPVAKAKPCSRSKLPLVPPSGKSSSCFLGDEVFVQPAKDCATKTTAAQAARNGMRMGTHRDKLGRWSTTEEGVIVPETTREINMFLDYGSSTVDVKLLRSLDWIEDYGAHVGGSVFLDMPEMGVEGLAEVLAIEPCPRLEEGEGRLVTGTFKHTSGEVYDLKLESESKPIGVTATHPFWSVDRNGWVSAIDLEIGETLKTLAGTTVVESRSKREGPETVYNIEVEGDHCYRVGESGVLVHNLSQKVRIFSEKYFGGDFSTHFIKPTTTGANGRAEKAEARICKTGGGEAAYQDPVGWNKSWNRGGIPRGKRRVARCHLLANILGGSGSKENLAPCCHKQNREMEEEELKIRDFVEEEGCVDILVIAHYSGPQSKIPTTITLKAVGQHCSNGRREDFGYTVTNPPRGLTTCPIV